MTARRNLSVLALGSLIWAPAALGHGIGARGDLPIPKNFFLFAAMLAVVLSFFVAAVMWPVARLENSAQGRLIGGADGPGRVVTALSVLARLVGLLGFVVVVIASWGGNADPSLNIAPVAVYVLLWIVVLWVCAFVGDIWRVLNPWDTLAMYVGGRVSPAPPPDPETRSLVYSYWPAVLGLLGFQWLELAHPDPSDPRVIAIAVTAYSVVVLAAAAKWGRRWIQTGEAFTALFSLVGAMAPIGRNDAGRMVRRPMFSGLAAVRERRGLAAVVLTVIGGTTFDGVSRSRWFVEAFDDIDGWARAGVNTVGLLAAIGAVSLGYAVATSLVARIGGAPWDRTASRFAASLVPIAVAYSVAHYFSLAMFEGQAGWRLLSDPYGEGWNLFGTADRQTNYRFIGTTTIALVQTAAIVIGHAASVILAHDRALQDFGRSKATASQVPMLALMVGLTVTGLTLLLSA